ncbi:MAG: alginate export family protein [Phycisphaerae bacterium]|nr:alginate export family protein [Phycisphaerae bacterium]
MSKIVRAYLWTMIGVAVLLAWTGSALAQETAPAAEPAAPAVTEQEVIEVEVVEEQTPPPPPPSGLEFSPEVESFIAQLKQPVPWFKWGVDQRLRDEYLHNVVFLNTHDNRAPADENYGRWRTRLWGTLSPVEDIDINARLTWEWRNYCTPPGKLSINAEESEVLLDTANVVWHNMFGQPVDMVVGRQDIVLGNGWLVLDGTPLDGSRTIYFDAVRFTAKLEESKTNIDLIYIDQAADPSDRVKPFNDQDALVTEQDERGAILWVTNKSLVPNAEVGGYFIYKHMNAEAANGDTGNIYTYGGRITGDLDEHWNYYAELAQQLGHKNRQDVCALGFNSKLTYKFNDKYNNQLRVGYEFLSGDEPGTDSTNEAWDNLWGRWPQFTEILIRTYTRETRIAQVTNMHRLGFGWTVYPHEKIEMCTDYNLLFADENSYRDRWGFSDSGCFRGQLLSWLLRYKINKHVSGHLVSEFFFPGDYYTDESNDPAVFLRAEVVLSL